jgi:hypothetical protein
MSYQVYFPEFDVTADAVVMDLAVHFTRGIESIRLRSTETAVNGIRRAFPDVEIYQGARRLA